MIKITQIDTNLSIYKNNKVVIIGVSNDDSLKDIVSLMKYHNIQIDRIFTSKKVPITSFKGIRISRFGEIHKYLKSSNTKVVMQLAFEDLSGDFENINKFDNVEQIISNAEACQILSLYQKFDLLKNSPKYLDLVKQTDAPNLNSSSGILRNVYFNTIDKDVLIVCSPPKTGNKTIETTLEKNNISIHNLQHFPRSFNKSFHSNFPYKTKIVTAVREPISQNISCMYEFLQNSNKSIFSIYNGFLDENVFFNGGDASKLLEVFDKYYGNTEFNKLQEFYGAYSIETYYNAFKDYIIDLSQYPFDKEKGYTIVKDGNLEVFVYQLEKLNDIATEFSNWVGETEFTKWNVTNEANDKWIANSYNQAKNEIKFTKEYFDRCFNEPWVNHFYSHEDISKFKDKWKSQIC